MTVDKMIAEACKKTGPLVGYPDVIEVLLCVGLPLETLAALRDGTWRAVPVEPTADMKEAWYEADMDAHEEWAAMLAAAPANPENENDR